MCNAENCNCHRTYTNDRHVTIDPRSARLPLVPPRVDYLTAVEPLEDRG